MTEYTHAKGICDICKQPCVDEEWAFPGINRKGHKRCCESCEQVYLETLEQIENIISDRDMAVISGAMLAIQQGADPETLFQNLSVPDKQMQRIRNALLYMIDKENR